MLRHDGVTRMSSATNMTFHILLCYKVTAIMYIAPQSNCFDSLLDFLFSHLHPIFNVLFYDSTGNWDHVTSIVGSVINDKCKEF